MKFNGKNNLGSRNIFVERKKFSAHAYSGEDYIDLTPKNTRDFWNKELSLYGKVSDSARHLMEPIEPYTPFLKPIPTKASPVYALNFVADAFGKFRQDYLLETSAGNLNAEDPYLSDITATKGYFFLDKEYTQFQKSFYSAFSRYLKINNIASRIQTFEDFVNEMFNFILTSGKVSYTRSSYTMSRFCDPMVSGLVIDISNLPYSQDEEKKKFLDSPNFEGYISIAARNGFTVHKNIPWKLVANLSSPAMLDFAREYQPSVDNYEDILDTFFIRTHHLEMPSFKKYVHRLYNQFVIDNPLNVRTTHTGASTNKVKQARKQLNKQEFDEAYNDTFWLANYIKVKNKETGLNYSDPAIKAITDVAIEILQISGQSSAMGYINGKFLGFEFYEGSLNYDNLRIKQKHGLFDSKGHSTKDIVTAKARKLRKKFY